MGTVHNLTLAQYQEMWQRITKWQVKNKTTEWPNYVTITDFKVGVDQVLKAQFLDMKDRVQDYMDSHNNALPDNIGIEGPYTEPTTGVNYGITVIADAALKVRDYIKTNGAIPSKVAVSGVEYTPQDFLWMLVNGLKELYEGQNPVSVQVQNFPTPASNWDTVTSGNLSEAAYMEVAKNIVKCGGIPAAAINDLGYLGWYNCLYAFSRIIAYYYEKGNLPATVAITPWVSVSVKIGTLQQKLIDAVGYFTTFTQFYNLCKGRIYSYYYNDVYKQDTAIYRLKNKLGLNCTDISQLGYFLAQEMGYEVAFEHVTCASGSGHIRLWIRGKEFGTTWIHVDLAAALSVGSLYDLGNVWCPDGTYYLVTPNLNAEAWLLNDDGDGG